MHVDLYEKIWMWAAAVIIAAFLGAIVFTTATLGSLPPSHVETINPQTVWGDARFAERGVFPQPDGSVEVRVIAMMFAFQPNEIRVPLGKRVTFRITAVDVLHGFQIVGTNGNTMVVPGYVSQFSTVFETPGEYLIVCNEYCGTGHHGMFGMLIVEEGP